MHMSAIFLTSQKITTLDPELAFYLNFDVARVVNVLLDNQAIVVESGLALCCTVSVGRITNDLQITVLGEPVALDTLGVVPGNAHALTTAASDSLHHHGVPHIVGKREAVVHVLWWWFILFVVVVVAC